MFNSSGIVCTVITVQGRTTSLPTWRPRLSWLPMVGLLGLVAGGATGAAVMLVSALVDPDVTFTDGGSVVDALGAVVPVAVLGFVFGAVAGVGVGLVVGLEMVFLVGGHLSREVARRRAYVLGFLLPPGTMLTAALLASGDATPLTWSEVLWWVIALGGSSVLGGPMARWLAGVQTRRSTVS